MPDKKKLMPFLILGAFAIVAVGGGIFIKVVSTPKTTSFGEKVAQMTEGQGVEEEIPEELARSRRAQQGGQFSDVNYGQSTLGMVKGFFANLFGDKKKAKTETADTTQDEGQAKSVPDPAELMKKLGSGQGGQGFGQSGGTSGGLAGPQTMAAATGDSGSQAFGEKISQTAEGEKLQTGQSRTQVAGGKKGAASKKLLSSLGKLFGAGDSKGAVGKQTGGGGTDLTQYAKAQYRFDSAAVKPGLPQAGTFIDPNKAMGVGEEDSDAGGSQTPGGQEKSVESNTPTIDDTRGIRAVDHDETCETKVQIQGPQGKDCGKISKTTYSGSDGWGSNDCQWSKKGEQIDVGSFDSKASGVYRRYILTYEDDSWFTGGNDGVKFWKIEYSDTCSKEPTMVTLDGEKGFKELVKDQLYMYNKCVFDGCKYKTNWNFDAIKDECYKKWPQTVDGDNLLSGMVPGLDRWPSATPKAYAGTPNFTVKFHTLGTKTLKVATGGVNHQDISAKFERIDACSSICDESTGIRVCP